MQGSQFLIVCSVVDARVSGLPHRVEKPTSGQPNELAAASQRAGTPCLKTALLVTITDDDAKLLADALFAVRSGLSMLLPAVTERVAQKMDMYKALQELVALYPWLPTLLAAVLRKKLRRPAPVLACLTELTTDEAARIGDGLGMLIVTSPNAKLAVDEWVLQSVAMGELQERHPWFVPMVERIAELLLTLVGRGMQLRVLLCAVLSYMDVISDAQVIEQYFASGQLMAAQASLGFLGLNMLFQIILCVVQTFAIPRR
jgi:hypothetical protein